MLNSDLRDTNPKFWTTLRNNFSLESYGEGYLVANSITKTSQHGSSRITNSERNYILLTVHQIPSSWVNGSTG